MKILLLVTAYNGLSQRLHIELLERGHTVSVELMLAEKTVTEGIALFQPDLIICPFLKQKIPDHIWQRHTCIIIHPGIKGDRGASSLDWAISHDETEWGVTALQAAEEMDAGDIWATATFKMRPGTKSSIYTLEVTEAAVKVALETVERFQNAGFRPEPLDYRKPDVLGKLQATMTQADRALDWHTQTSAELLRKINAADGSPGVLDSILGASYFLYGGWPEDTLKGQPGELIATRNGAVCRATVDGAIWLSHLKKKAEQGGRPVFKLPATQVLGDKIDKLPEIPVSIYNTRSQTFREIWYEEKNGVGYLHFDFHNGAMSTEQCTRLRDAYEDVQNRPTRVLVLVGGRTCWSNGIHLNKIEAAANPAEESWRNINAIDDLVLAILNTQNKLTFAGIHGNAGAGGVMLALACDKVCAREGVVFNPHYKAMGLYGSEYWTYTLPRRVGYERALSITEGCLPMGMHEAKRIGMVDFVLQEMFSAFDLKLEIMAESMAQSNNFDKLLANKQARRKHDEFIKPLRYYRHEELRIMRDNFYQTDSIYHAARQQFVYKKAADETPGRLALHRLEQSVSSRMVKAVPKPMKMDEKIA